MFTQLWHTCIINEKVAFMSWKHPKGQFTLITITTVYKNPNQTHGKVAVFFYIYVHGAFMSPAAWKQISRLTDFFFFLQIWSLHCRTYSVLCVHVCSCCKAIRPFAEFSTRSLDIHNQLECCGKCCGQLCLLDKAVVQKTIIDTLHKESEPQTFIAKEAGCSQSAVSKHVNRKLSGRKKCGRKRCTTNSCRQRRLTWTKKKNWTVAQWSKVLFSDESKFCISIRKPRS